ncbi:MAG: PKD domain-containing protein [Candidatus Thiodiazotropha sp.]
MSWISNKNISLITIMTLCGFGSAGIPKANAEEIFSGTFDATPDWQNDGSQRCSRLDWDEVSGETACADMPLNYDLIYVTDRNPTTPMCEINSSAARGAAGKGFRMYDESNGDRNSWGSDCQIAKYFTTQYPEVWSSFYIRYNPDMIWDTATARAKIFRIGHYNPLVVDGTAGTSVFSTNNSSEKNKGLGRTTSGLFFLGTKQEKSPALMRLRQAVRCAPQYKCGSYDESWFQNFSGTPGDSWWETLGDGNWHLVEVRTAMNSAPGVADGIVEVYFDGVLQTMRTDVPWRMEGVDPAVVRGFNLFSIAGNSDNVWDGQSNAEQWVYDIDDVKICTTRCSDYGPSTPTLAAPMISPGSGEHSTIHGATVSIAATPGATIYYTTDGTDPDPSDASQQYTGEFTLFSDTQVKALAVQEDYIDSRIAVADYTFVGNQAPVLLGVENKSVTQGSTLSFVLTVNDPDTGPGSLEVSGIPLSSYQASLTDLEDGSYRFDWLVPMDILGDYVINLTATDGLDPDLTISDTLTITVTDPASQTIPTQVPDTLSTKAETNGNTTETLAYDSGTSGSNRALVVAVGYEQLEGVTVSSITYNGADMVRVQRTDVANGRAYEENLETWVLVEPDPGVHDVVVTFSSSPSDWAISAATYQNVDPNQPIGAIYDNAGNSDPGSLDQTITLTTSHDSSRIITASVLDGTTDRPLDPAANDLLVVNAEAYDSRNPRRGFVMGLFSQPAPTSGEYTTGFNADPADTKAWAINAFELRGTSGSDGDGDDDGMPDDWEITHGLDPYTNDAASDLDGDGLSNLDEYLAGTLPGNTDSDGDLMTDGWEVDFGLDPVDPQDAAQDNDGDGVSNVDEFLANSNPTLSNAPPIANAVANQTILFGGTISLDASASSDPDNQPQALSYRWTFGILPSDSTLTDSDIQNGDSINASFTPDKRGIYTLSLEVSDGEASSSDMVSITVLNNAPVADAGADRNATIGSTVILDGGESRDEEGDPISYQWQVASVPAGSAVTTDSLQNAATSSPRFVPDLEGSYVIELVVNDGFDDSAPDQVVLTATPAIPELVPGTLSSKAEVNGSTTEALSYNSGTTGNNRALVLAIGYEQLKSGVTVSSISYNGTHMTRVQRTNAASRTAFNENLETWVLTDPDPGIHDLVITFNNDPSDWAITAATYQGVDPNSPIGVTYRNAGHSDPDSQDEVISMVTTHSHSRIITASVLDGATDRPLDPAANDRLVVNVDSVDSRNLRRGFVMGLFSQQADVPGGYTTGFNANPASASAWAINAFELRGLSSP